MTASERWWALSQDEQDAENRARVESGQKTIPTHRHRQVDVSPPILLSLSPERGIRPVGECLACGHIMELSAWKDAPLGDVTHGICGPCFAIVTPFRGHCSPERGCQCEAMGESNARREREIRERDKKARLALAREESRGGS